MLIATDRPEHILESLKRENVIANVIGELVGKEKGLYITGTDDIRRGIMAPKPDEIYRLQGRA
jgi:hydrogenase maturation factor